MKYISQVAVLIFTVWLCDKVKCSPHRRYKSFQKSFQFQIQPIPLQHFSVILKKITPFRGYEIKHSIKKRQVIQPDVAAPIEGPRVEEGSIEDIMKIPSNSVVDNADDIPLKPNLTPQVIITSIIKPIEDGGPFSILLPDGSGLPAGEPEPELKVTEVASSSETVVEITPKPIVPPENVPVKNVIISNPAESTVPSISKIPLVQNPNRPFLFTDITRIPLSGSYPVPTIGVPEFIAPSASLLPLLPPTILPPPKPVSVLPPVTQPPPPPLPEIPPPVKEEVPIIREESPNLLVKGSRFILYFGSMMLQMLSHLVNGRINLSQPIDIPLPTNA